MAGDDSRRPRPRRSTGPVETQADPMFAALQAAVLRTRRMFEAAFDAVLVVDGDGQVLDLNPAAEALFGWPLDEVAGRPIDGLIIPEAARARHRDGLLRQRMADPNALSDAPRRLTAVHRDGREVPIELKVLRMDDGGFVRFVGIARPVVAVDDALSQERRRAESTFVASLSHDIRTPLSAIMTLSDLVATEDDPAAIKRYIGRINVNARALRGLVGDLLDVAMLDVEHLAVEPQEVDLTALLDATADTVAGQLTDRPVELRTTFDYRMPDLILTDPRRLEQVLGNLLNNARKMTDVGHIELGGRLIARDGERAQLRLWVADTGPGIPRAMRTRLFERFSRSSSGVWSERAGSGLGLSICKALVELLGGRLTFVTEVGRGTTFFIDLDVEVIEQPADSMTAAVPVFQHFAPEHRWILVVDDSEDNRIALGESLRRRGWTVSVAADGHEALTMAMNGYPDAILMDVEMAGLDGLQTTRRIRQLEAERRTPARTIFALTGHATAEMRARCMAAGMNGFYTKPFDLDRLHGDLWHLISTDEAPAGDAPTDMDATLPASDVSGLDENIRRHLPAYFANRRQDVEHLRAAAAAADLTGVARITHRLRGTCGLYGMPTLVALAQHIEQLVGAGQTAAIHSAIDAFDAELQQLAEAVSGED